MYVVYEKDDKWNIKRFGGKSCFLPSLSNLSNPGSKNAIFSCGIDNMLIAFDFSADVTPKFSLLGVSSEENEAGYDLNMSFEKDLDLGNQNDLHSFNPVSTTNSFGQVFISGAGPIQVVSGYADYF